MSDPKANDASFDFDEPGAGWSNGALQPLYEHSLQGKREIYNKHRRWIGLHSSWSRIGANDHQYSRSTSFSSTGSSLLDKAGPEQEATAVRALMAQLCESFYKLGWATGTGGGISIRVGGNNRKWRVFVAPSGVQKEDLIGADMFELDMEGKVVQGPTSNPALKQSACTPLWFVIYQLRPTATAVLHTHSPNAVYATLLDETSPTLRLTHLEMLKGVGNHAYDDVLEIPIIDNRPTEDLLAHQLAQAVRDYPKTNAVLVRRHGLYCWGDSWEQCKTHAESIDYLLGAAVQMKMMGVDPSQKPRHGTYRVSDETMPVANNNNNNNNNKKKRKMGFHATAANDNTADVQSNLTPLLPRDAQYKALVLDIEGCTTSIAFVRNVLFPFVRDNLETYLQEHVVGKPIEVELQQGLLKEVQQVASETPKSHSIVDLVHYLMDGDVKSAALKDLQGRMWQAGYQAGQLKGHVYSDVKTALEWMNNQNVPVYIYSSGSIQAQKLLFGHTVVGNLLSLIAGHFDIPTCGGKKQASSYQKIAQLLDLEPSQVVFCSDAVEELQAAQQAGIGCPVMSIRPGNAPLNGNQFPAIYSLLQLCGQD